jgi:hypothetical protein
MKIKITSFCAIVLLASSALLNAGEPAQPVKGSAEFEKMKSLAGAWKGTTDIGQGPVEMTVQYRVLAGGSVLEERVFPGTPMEMITMYYDKGGKLALTHYCVVGNRPAMLLKSSDAKTLNFDFDKSCGIDVTQGMIMHGLTLRFDDAETITTSCRSFVNGQAQEEHACTLKRVKS